MGTVVCLPAGPDLISQCNRCAACLPKAFGKRGVVSHCPTVPSSDSVYRLAEVHQSSDGSVTHRLIEAPRAEHHRFASYRDIDFPALARKRKGQRDLTG
uniref:Uncharacterized protein n=1 Tax=Anopheles farauti TaxID=69004 RepID=A0A182QZ24_9DIPT